MLRVTLERVLLVALEAIPSYGVSEVFLLLINLT
jgi:hypothetical protein